jgi:hypothetical protein
MHGIFLLSKLEGQMNFPLGSIISIKAISALTDLSSWSKEIDISNLKEIKNMNWSTLGEDILLI